MGGFAHLITRDSLFQVSPMDGSHELLLIQLARSHRFVDRLDATPPHLVRPYRTHPVHLAKSLVNLNVLTPAQTIEAGGAAGLQQFSNLLCDRVADALHLLELACVGYLTRGVNHA